MPLEELACPSYLITTAGNTIASVGELEEAKSRIRDCRSEVLPGDAYDIVARYPDTAGPLVASFTREAASGQSRAWPSVDNLSQGGREVR
jgi:hypothetical protein